jgi:hypothetical protein
VRHPDERSRDECSSDAGLPDVHELDGAAIGSRGDDASCEHPLAPAASRASEQARAGRTTPFLHGTYRLRPARRAFMMVSPD